MYLISYVALPPAGKSSLEPTVVLFPCKDVFFLAMLTRLHHSVD